MPSPLHRSLLRTALSRPKPSATRHAGRQPRRSLSRSGPQRAVRARLKDIYGPEPAPPPNVYDANSMARYEQVRRAYWYRRQRIGYVGAVFGMTGLAVCGMLLPSQPQKLDAPSDAPPFEPGGATRQPHLRPRPAPRQTAAPPPPRRPVPGDVAARRRLVVERRLRWRLGLGRTREGNGKEGGGQRGGGDPRGQEG